MNDCNAYIIIIVIVIFVFMIIGGIMGYDVGRKKEKERMQKEAIEANVAEWNINSKTGETSFVYLTPKKEEK